MYIHNRDRIFDYTGSQYYVHTYITETEYSTTQVVNIIYIHNKDRIFDYTGSQYYVHT
jgi:hypothetical protein